MSTGRAGDLSPDEQRALLEQLLRDGGQKKPDRRIAIIVDGLDHADRIHPRGSPATAADIAQELAELKLPQGVTLIVGSQPGAHLAASKGPTVMPTDPATTAVMFEESSPLQDDAYVSGRSPLVPDAPAEQLVGPQANDAPAGIAPDRGETRPQRGEPARVRAVKRAKPVRAPVVAPVVKSPNPGAALDFLDGCGDDPLCGL